MKRVFFAILFLTLGVFAQVNDRAEYKLVYADSISNSQTKTAYLDLRNVEAFDSIGLALVQYGAVSMDSVIAWYPGFIDNIPNKTFGTLRVSYFGSGTNVALSADQKTTGTNTAYAVATTRLTKANVLSYPNLKFTFASLASGNTASATAQRVALYVIFYR